MRRWMGLAGLTAIFWTTSASAATIDVGPGDSYSKIEAATPGDEVVIQPGTYKFRVYLSANGTAGAPIVIRAADPQNRPVWDLNGQNVESWPGSYTGGDNGRGCWQVTGTYYDISGVEIHGCHTSSGNAANIRTVAADHVRVRDAYLHGSDAGFTGDGENISVEFSEISDNGQPSNPPQHNFYIYGGSFALRYSYVHDSVGGQNLHIRARDSTIEYNWIARAANYEVDMMTGNDPTHSMLFRGNVLLGNPNPANGGQVMVLYNDSGSLGIEMSLQAVWNTFVIQAGSNPILVNVNNQGLSSAALVFSNNIVVGTNQAYAVDSGTQNYTVSGTLNWFETGADPGVLSASIFGSDPGFLGAGSYRLGPSSQAIGAADQNAGNAPDREYFDNEANAMKFRWRPQHADLGAFESTTMGGAYGPYDDPGNPPPGTGGGGGAGGGATSGSGGGATSGSGGGATSATGSGGASTGGSGGSGSGDEGGCGCHAAGGTNGSTAAWLVLLFALARITKCPHQRDGRTTTGDAARGRNRRAGVAERMSSS